MGRIAIGQRPFLAAEQQQVNANAGQSIRLACHVAHVDTRLYHVLMNQIAQRVIRQHRHDAGAQAQTSKGQCGIAG
jgi:hypothetical protein